MERKALMWTCLLKPQTKSGRIPKYPYCKKARTCQCLFKRFPANHHFLAIGRKKKMDWYVLFSPTNGIILGPPISITQHINCNLQVKEKFHHTRIPLLARMFQERGADGVFQVKQFLWWTISIWGFNLFLCNFWKMWVLSCMHVNWDHKTPLCTVSHCHLGHLCDTGLSHMDLLQGVLTWTGFQPE